MDLQTRKRAFVQEFLKVQSEDLIFLLEKILHNQTKLSGHDDFKPMTIAELNARIDKSMDDSKNGRLIEASELKAKIEKWL